MPNNIDCPYKDNCTSYPWRCDTCRHNKSKKKDYYEPDYDYWHWSPPWPGYPYPYIWCSITTNPNPNETIMYKSSKKKNYYKEE